MHRLVTPRWLLAHVGVVVAVVAFLALGWWQVRRAAEGNLLSYGYAVEWPVFAGFVIFVWVKEMRAALRRAPGDAVAGKEPGVGGESATSPVGSQLAGSQPGASRSARRPRSVRTGAAYDDSDDPQLAAYNKYLAWLNANPQASPSDYRG